MHIDRYDFGQIVIDGVTYRQDVLIWPGHIKKDWWRRQGHQVRRTASSYWVEMSARVWQAFPYHWLIRPTAEELDHFLRQERAVALRYSTFLDSPQGCLSYHAVLTDAAYDLKALGKKARYDVRLGLKNCEVQPISFEQLAEAGWRRPDRRRRGRQLLRVADEVKFGAIVAGRRLDESGRFYLGVGEDLREAVDGPGRDSRFGKGGK